MRAAGQPGFAEQPQRDQRGLACPGLGLEDGRASGGQRGAQLDDDVLDRQPRQWWARRGGHEREGRPPRMTGRLKG